MYKIYRIRKSNGHIVAEHGNFETLEFTLSYAKKLSDLNGHYIVHVRDGDDIPVMTFDGDTDRPLMVDVPMLD